MTPHSMALIAGAVLALLIGLFASGTGMDRDRAFYPVVTIVTASYYALFAILGESTHALVVESLIGSVFLAAAVLGFKGSLWLVVVAFVAHGIFDLGHASIISNPGVPGWWPSFCLTFDVTIAAYLWWLLRSGRFRAKA